MRYFLPTLAAAMTTLVARPQCDISIPPNAYVISAGGTTVGISDTVVWICADVTNLVLSGSNNTYIMEGYGSVGLTGTDNTAYIRNGNYWSVIGNDNTVYEGFGADAQLGGGSNSTVIECVSMIIDVSNAPANACSGVGIAETRTEAPITAALNGDVLAVTVHGNPARWSITDALGRTVRSGTLRTGMNNLDVRALPAGTYQLHDQQHGRVVLRFAKQ